jgi:N-methylhydantoinase B
VLVNVGAQDERRLPAKVGRYPLAAGDVLRICTPGAGGYGDPLERDALAVLRDVRNGRVSHESAERDYGVVVREGDAGLEVDAARTAASRLRRDGNVGW